MSHKCAISVLSLFVLLSLTFAQNSLYLGTGIRDEVINLEAGAKQPGQSYQFGQSGFVTPSMPQTMALSPNTMINEANGLLEVATVAANESLAAKNESVSARDEAKAMNSEMRSLLSRIEGKEQSIQSLLTRAEQNAEASETNLRRAQELLNRTEDAFNDTLALSEEVRVNLSQMNSLKNDAEKYANASLRSAQLAKESESSVLQLHNETNGIFEQCQSIYDNVTRLKAEILQ
jgi:hypothetical protein